MKTNKEMVYDVECIIENNLKKLHQFKPDNNQNNEDLFAIINDLNKSLQALEELHNDKFIAHEFFNLALTCESGTEKEYNQFVKFLKDAVKENVNLYSSLSSFFNID